MRTGRRRPSTRLSGLIAVGAPAFVTACTAAPDDAADTGRSPRASAERSSGAPSGAPSAAEASANLLRAAGEGDTGAVRAAMARALVPADPDYSLLNRYGGTSLIPAGEHGHAAYVREVLRSTDVDVDHNRPLAQPVPDLDRLAEACATLGRWSFMLVLAPPRITGITGLVVNPVAVF
ncbi:hypothetical protein [Streptomyces sp. NPDC051684]|uniref:hypothetical protein n=1 Tax=Streptomyces sp. NPDC051684 TaxID=3365670 RepID=UPI003793EDC9